MRFLGGALHVGVTAAQKQAARRAYARAYEAEICRGIEEARVPGSPARQKSVDLVAQTHGPSLTDPRRARNARISRLPQKFRGVLRTAARTRAARIYAEMQMWRRRDCVARVTDRAERMTGEHELPRLHPLLV
jgi:hypothetical protein